MIKVEKGMCEIKAVNGVPDIMTDLACIIRSIRTTMVEKRDYSEAETKELVEQAVRLGLQQMKKSHRKRWQQWTK